MGLKGLRAALLVAGLAQFGWLTWGCARPQPETGGEVAAEPEAGAPTDGSGVGPVELQVFAAASLTGVADELAAAFELAKPGCRVLFNLEGTQQLQVQIEAGAAADVLLSADLEHAEALFAAGLVAEPRPFVGNRLVVARHADASQPVKIDDLAMPGTKVIACAPEVPAGGYAVKALEALAAERGEELVEAIRGNIVSYEENVAMATAKIALGEVDAGFIYATDARHAELVEVDLPEVMQVLAEYRMCRVLAGQRANLAEAFLDWLTSAEAAAVFTAAGFTPAVQPVDET